MHALAGKTTFIRYLLGRSYPGAHIGPEPTTDRFVVVNHGLEERRCACLCACVVAGAPRRCAPCCSSPHTEMRLFQRICCLDRFILRGACAYCGALQPPSLVILPSPWSPVMSTSGPHSHSSQSACPPPFARPHSGHCGPDRAHKAHTRGFRSAPLHPGAGSPATRWRCSPTCRTKGSQALAPVGGRINGPCMGGLVWVSWVVLVGRLVGLRGGIRWYLWRNRKWHALSQEQHMPYTAQHASISRQRCFPPGPARPQGSRAFCRAQAVLREC
jgi:hypothetical protein